VRGNFIFDVIFMFIKNRACEKTEKTSG